MIADKEKETVCQLRKQKSREKVKGSRKPGGARSVLTKHEKTLLNFSKEERWWDDKNMFVFKDIIEQRELLAKKEVKKIKKTPS